MNGNFLLIAGDIIRCSGFLSSGRPLAQWRNPDQTTEMDWKQCESRGDLSSSSGETIKILSKSTPGEIVATIGGGHACVMSLAFHPTSPNSFVVGRKDGTIDIYSSATVDLSFRRMHRFLHGRIPCVHWHFHNRMVRYYSQGMIMENYIPMMRRVTTRGRTCWLR